MNEEVQDAIGGVFLKLREIKLSQIADEAKRRTLYEE